ERSSLPWGRAVEHALLDLAEATGTLPIAGGVVTHARRSHFPAQDVHLCAESLCLVDEVIGRKPRRHPDQPSPPDYPERSLNAERFLRTGAEMGELFADRPDLLTNTLRLVDRCDDDVLPGRAPLPSVFGDDTAALAGLVRTGAREVYGPALTPAHEARLDHELRRIARLGFSSHFVIAWEFCRWSRGEGIGMSGRGSVVDSAVAYVHRPHAPPPPLRPLPPGGREQTARY
ncbi:MAG: hypothetical protein C4320_09785, partial [Armatimonadota bacterium]